MKLTATISTALAIGNVLTTGLLIPAPQGPYKTTHQAKELIDHSRPDPWSISHPRRLMISRFDPIPPPECIKTCKIPYMSPLVASSEDEIYNYYLEGSGISWPTGVLAQLELETCCSPKPSTARKKIEYPIVLLGTGLNTTRLFYSATAQRIASKGYIVITMDHPYETDIVEFPDGTVVYGGNVVGDLNNTAPLVRALDIRADDASFILDHESGRVGKGHGRNGRVRAGVVGHSFGGAAAATILSKDSRFAGGVNMDGYMFGPVLDRGIGRDQAFLLWGSVGHNSSVDPSWGEFLATVRGQGQTGKGKANGKGKKKPWIKEVSVRGSGHGSFWDVALIADVAGWRESQSEDFIQAIVGDILGSRVMEIMGEYLDNFLRMAIKGDGEGLLSGPSASYPEVEFL